MPFKLRFIIIITFLLLLSTGLMVNGNSTVLKNLKSGNESDTTYSGQITVRTSILEFPLPNATVKFSLVETINQTKLLVKEGLTDQNGELIIDRLPILGNFVGIAEISNFRDRDNLLFISNNGMASDHAILIKHRQKISKAGSIIDMNGRMVATVKLSFNPVLESYEGFWKGSSVKSGTYVFYVETETGTIAGKISHISAIPGMKKQISQGGFKHSSFNKALKESSLNSSKYEIEIISEVGETLIQNAYIAEQTSYEFNFPIIHIPIPDARIQGVVTINRTTLAPNAVMLWSSLLSSAAFTTYTDANGFYSKDDVPVAIDDQFTNPEWDRYYLTINIGDSITFKVDPVLVFSGELTTKDCNINILSK